jgi:hypothetical protein
VWCPLALLLVALLTSTVRPADAPPSKISRWDRVRRGANLFNREERVERLRAARAAGITLVRLAPNKWLNGRPLSAQGDFLVGPRDRFDGIPPSDLRRLREVLDEAHRAGLEVVLTMVSLPGSRWAQHNGGVEERRIWTSADAQADAIRFWVELATALRDHPAVIGYNIRNEPSPERVAPVLADWYTGNYAAWYRSVRGTPADLNQFYARVVAAIRRVDPETPIVLDSGFFATPRAFDVLEPVGDEKTLYSFHMYEPYAYTNPRNKGAYVYPGRIPIGESGTDEQAIVWNRDSLDRFLQPVLQWQQRNRIPSSRVFAGEFGVVRTHGGAAAYLRDLIDVFESHGWHWAFYGFREDEWPAMDYELGTGRVPAAWWEAEQRQVLPDPKAIYRPNELWTVLTTALSRDALAVPAPAR